MIIRESPNAPRPGDPLVLEVSDMLARITVNYGREGSGPGSRFEGRLLEDIQAEAVLRFLSRGGEHAMTDSPADSPRPTATAITARAFMKCVDTPVYLRVIETRAVNGGWAGARGAGLWDTRQSDAVAEAAVDYVLDLFRMWAAECDRAAS
jgi:hypothetical protein